jgi:hypothetical protein
MIDASVEKLGAELKAEISEMFRAVMGESDQQSGGYVDAEAVARLLGRDLSSPENIRKAKKYVYNLAAQRLIPSIKISERNIVFDPVKIREYLKAKEQAAA